MSSNFHVILQSRPGVNGEPSASNFYHEACLPPLSDLAPGEVTIRTCYLSVDPAQRCQMNEDTGAEYLAAWQLGQTIIGLCGVGVVEASNCPSLQPGDMVTGSLEWPWCLRFNVNAEQKKNIYQKLDSSIFGSQPSLALSVLVGITSLVGIREKGHVTPGANQVCVVSGAAGACGSLAGQIAQLDGCTNIVGICGTDKKCEWLTDDLGFNHAVNYKTEDVGAKLKQACPKGIDVYFDNVGGALSDTVIAQMNKDSHIVLCGQISQYNKDVPYPPPLPDETTKILKDRNITRDRFTIVNYPDQFESATKELVTLILTGKIKYRETISEGLASAGEAFVSMMSGGNIGKQIVHVSDP